MAPIHRTVSLGSLTVSSGDSKNKQTSTRVTCGFKYNWFETTLNFVKDDRRMSLKYGVTAAQAEFIRDVLNFEEYPSYKLEKYTPLYEALKIIGLKFKFKLSRVSKDAIVLQKIPKSQSHFLEPNSTSETLSPRMEREKRVIDRISRDYMVEKTQTILDFIDDPSRASLEFTNVTPLEANFLQTVMTAARPMFPEHAQMLEYMKKLKPTLDFALQVLVGKINKKNFQRTVSFKKVPKIGKKGKRPRENSLNRSNMSLNSNFATPTYEQPNTSQNITHNIVNSTQTSNSMEIENNKTSSMQTEMKSTVSNTNSMQNEHNSVQNAQNSMQNGQNSTQNGQNSKQTQQKSMHVKQKSMQIEQKSMQVERNSQEPMDVDSPRSIDSMNSSAISVQSEPTRVLDRIHSPVAGPSTGLNNTLGTFNYGSQNNLSLPSTSTNNTERGVRGDVSSLKPSKARLLADLSMPVQLDKPTRMMQKMGWNGGPLGIRGNGITEPIMPALHLVSKAGFGHIGGEPSPSNRHVEQVSEPVVKRKKKDKKPEKPKKGHRGCFRVEILQTVLDLVVSDSVSVVIEYSHMISKNDIKFVRHVVTSLSERHYNIPNLSKAETRVAKRVLEVLEDFPNIVVHGSASECQKKVTIRKVIIVNEGDMPLLPHTKVIKVDDLIAMADLVEGQKYVAQAPKVKRYVGTKITILIEILHFLQFSEEFRELVFEASLTKLERNYITKTVDHLTRRKKMPSYHTMRTEDEIYDEILSVIDDSVFTVSFDLNKPSVLLEKVEIQSYNNNDTSELHPEDGKNKGAVPNAFNGISLNESALSYLAQKMILNNNSKGDTNKNCNNNVSAPNNSSVRNDVNGKLSKDNGDITVDGNQESLHVSKVNLNDSNSVNGAKNINKMLETTPGISGGSKTDVNRNVNNDSMNNNDISSDNDDVIVIETVHEIIVISDDDSSGASTENAQSTDRSVKTDEVVKKQGKEEKIRDVAGNADGLQVSEDLQNTQKDTDSNIRVCKEIADMGILNSQGSGENEITRDSANIMISNAQNCTSALDISNIQGTKEHSDISKSNSQNSTTCDNSNIEENVQIDKTKDSADKSIFNIEKQDSTKLDMSIIQDCVDVGVDISKPNTDNSELDIPNINRLDGRETGNTDINNTVKVDPKREKLSYSEEFDKDLHDLEQVLLLDDDDDVFDYTIIKKEKDYSTDKIERPSSKRSRSDSVESTPDNSKKTKVFTFRNRKNLMIVPKDYPDVEITKECTIKIQNILLHAIEKCNQLPLLKCHGKQDGGLVYSCHDEQTLFFFENSLSVASDYKIISDVRIKNVPYSMKIRFNSLLDNVKTLFNLLELYNAGLITDSWCVRETQTFEDYIVIFVDMDDYSYRYICDNNFCLYAGIDEARFSVVWD